MVSFTYMSSERFPFAQAATRLEKYKAALASQPQEGTYATGPFEDVLTDLEAAVDGLRNAILDRVKSKSNDTPILMYFDEVHSLIDSGKLDDYSRYHALCSVLTRIEKFKVFALFLSTVSLISGLAPPLDKLPASYRPEDVTYLQPPFVELPFDAYFRGPIIKEGTRTLGEVCDIGFMARFGRPLCVPDSADSTMLIIP
jgi:hypothetical protein